MKLRDLFERMRPMFVGKATPADTARAIYGDAADGAYGRRLELYDNSRSGRAREMALAFPRTAAALGDRWTDLAYEYFVAHPQGRYDWAPDGEPFAGHLAAMPEIAPWIAELAALEWALYDAPPPEPATASGPLRLAPGVAVRTFRHDLPRWLLRHERPPAPATRAAAAVLWTQADGEARFLPLEDYQSVLLDQLARGELDLGLVPASEAASERALQQLHKRGIVVGDLTGDPIEEVVMTLGRDLSARYQLAPGARFTWVDGELALGAPSVADRIASDDVAFVAIASTIALPCSISEALATLSELPPAMVVETLDALFEARLLIPAAPIAEARASIAIERPVTEAIAPLLAHPIPPHLQLVPLREHGVTTIYISAQLAPVQVPLATIAADAGTLASALLEAARSQGMTVERSDATLPLSVWPEPVFAAIVIR